MRSLWVQFDRENLSINCTVVKKFCRVLTIFGWVSGMCFLNIMHYYTLSISSSTVLSVHASLTNKNIDKHQCFLFALFKDLGHIFTAKHYANCIYTLPSCLRSCHNFYSAFWSSSKGCSQILKVVHVFKVVFFLGIVHNHWEFFYTFRQWCHNIRPRQAFMLFVCFFLLISAAPINWIFLLQTLLYLEFISVFAF